ncbi:MAG TPA: hypothetical protein VK086_01320 [Ruania sp.]|nr:hypothetical protein [Ruania sp.]
MRAYLLPAIGAALILIGIVMVVISTQLATAALILEGIGVVLLGVFLGINFWRRRPRR